MRLAVATGLLLALTGCSSTLACRMTPYGCVFPAWDFVCSTGTRTPCPTTRAATTDAERTVELGDELGGATFLYVISVIRIERATDDGVAAGFNLDGLDSGSGSVAVDSNCEEFNQDFRSELDPSRVGVDNAMQGLVGIAEGLLDPMACPFDTTDGCINPTIRSRITEGTLLLLLEVSDVDSFTHDPSVSVSMWAAELQGGGRPELGADSRIAAEQIFEPGAVLGVSREAAIFRGRLRATFLSLDLSIGENLPTPPESHANVEMRFDIDELALTRGQLGGEVAMDDVRLQAEPWLPDATDPTGFVRSFLESFADLHPSDGDATLCEALSVGYELEAVRAARPPF